MFKKIRMIKNLASTAKEVIVEERSKASQEATGISGLIQKTAAGVFQRFIDDWAKPTLLDEQKFLEAVDAAYDNFPFQVKIVLRRKRFRRMMLSLNEKYRQNEGQLTDQKLKELIGQVIQEERTTQTKNKQQKLET